MGRAKPQPQPKPEAVILPPEFDEDDEEAVGGGIPDDDGWVHLEGRKEPEREDKKPKRQPARRRSQ